MGPPARGDHPRLTRRELEICALVAQGLTNKQIANRLFIAERTADGHLEHIREKLGAGTRAQVASWYTAQAHARDDREAAPRFSNLPSASTTFIGRLAELQSLVSLLGSGRLVSICGPGGSGKTRLAIEAASRLADSFSIVAFLDLAALSPDAAVDRALVAALGGRDDAADGAIETLATLLANRRALVILDNCEHVIERCSQVAAALLPAAPGLTLMTTSREMLRVPGESVLTVSSMEVEDAVDLFVERSQAGAPRSANGPDRDRVAQICERVDRIPLAVELAAAWSGVLSADDLLARLEHRLPLLVRGPRSAPDRQKTLRATIDWSHQLLDSEQQVLLRKLSVFAGDFSVGAVEAVCAGAGLDRHRVLDLLADLVAKSLVSPVSGVTQDSRYRLLETVREYAGERLRAAGEEAATRDAHLRHYMTWVIGNAERLHGREQLAWLDRFEQDRGNLLAALDWGEVTSPALALDGAAHLYWFWRFRGPFGEGPERFARLLKAAPDAPPRVRAHALEGAGRLAVHEADWETADRCLTEATAIWRSLGEDVHVARTLVAVAMMNEAWLLTGDPAQLRPPEPVPALKEAVKLARLAGDHLALSYALIWLAQPAARENAAAGRQLLTEAFEVASRAGDQWMTASAEFQLGHMLQAQRDYRGALEAFVRTLGLFRGLREPWGVGISLGFAAKCHLLLGALEDARALALDSFLVPGALPQPVAFEVLAGVSAAAGKFERAVRLHGIASGLPTPDPRLIEALDEESWAGQARESLTSEAVEEAWREGSRMRPADAVGYALAAPPA